MIQLQNILVPEYKNLPLDFGITQYQPVESTKGHLEFYIRYGNDESFKFWMTSSLSFADCLGKLINLSREHNASLVQYN
jgi:hypothetical protein